jgi:hypothetical protein
MSQVHFEENTRASAESFLGIDDMENQDMYMSSQVEEDEEQLEVSSQDEEPDTTEMENNVSSFPPFQTL